MKKLFTTETKYLNSDLALLVARVAFGLLMLTHGIPNMQMLFSGDPVQFPAVFGMSPELSLSLAVFAEVFCSVLVIAGFATRLATIPLITTMVVAVFSIHAADAFAVKELAVIYLAAYLVLFVAGSGRYSVDQLIQGRRKISYAPVRRKDDPTYSIYS